MKKQKLVLKPRERICYEGSSRLADRLGCSRTHLSMVLHGTRGPGKKLAAQLKRLGVKWPVAAEEGGAR